MASHVANREAASSWNRREGEHLDHIALQLYIQAIIKKVGIFYRSVLFCRQKKCNNYVFGYFELIQPKKLILQWYCKNFAFWRAAHFLCKNSIVLFKNKEVLSQPENHVLKNFLQQGIFESPKAVISQPFHSANRR